MQLFVRARELHTLEVTGQETLAQIKAHVASLEGIAPEDQVLLVAGMPLEDEATLGQCQVEALSTLAVVDCVLGGKVHGSVACVEKVALRGQTFKVAKQEKKKTTGQPKRCMQYNWLFVNVVPTFGKKGPNANS
ncbi:ubiquitin-like protein FUBI [Oryx dammah]|uniref:ubiquitin-like protein FUBI n=1 Tax=Oryx dammah TaxID=59534 RepID=UPI001A9B5916|nr:ubiquitin-like protein FUBI [Oryx dammah]